MIGSFRKKPGALDENKDAPVAATPRATDTQPPAAEVKPLEPVEIETKSPVEEAAQNALKQRIEEMERAEQLAQQSSAPQPPPEAPPPQPPPQQRPAPPVPAAVQKLLADNPQYLRDEVAEAELNLGSERCVRDGLTWNDDNFIPTVERYLRLASDTNHRGANGGPVEVEPRPTPQPQRQAPVQRSTVAMS